MEIDACFYWLSALNCDRQQRALSHHGYASQFKWSGDCRPPAVRYQFDDRYWSFELIIRLLIKDVVPFGHICVVRQLLRQLLRRSSSLIFIVIGDRESASFIFPNLFRSTAQRRFFQTIRQRRILFFINLRCVRAHTCNNVAR